MEQKKKKQEDVLVVRDEKTGEISVVAGLDARGYPKRAHTGKGGTLAGVFAL